MTGFKMFEDFQTDEEKQQQNTESVDSKDFNNADTENQKLIIASIQSKKDQGIELSDDEKSILGSHQRTIEMVEDLRSAKEKAEDAPDLKAASETTIENLEAQITTKKAWNEDTTALELELIQSKEILEYLNKRDYLDDSANIHNAETGKFIAAEKANSSDVDLLEQDEYENMTINELTTKWAEAEDNQDRTTSTHIQDELQNRLEREGVNRAQGMSEDHKMQLIDTLHAQMIKKRKDIEPIREDSYEESPESTEEESIGINLGDQVSVKRTSGDIESDWFVESIHDVNGVKMARVVKTDEQGKLVKNVPASEISLIVKDSEKAEPVVSQSNDTDEDVVDKEPQADVHEDKKSDEIKAIEQQIADLINLIDEASPEEKDRIRDEISKLEYEKDVLVVDSDGIEQENKQEVHDKLSLATIRIGDIATRIREAAERDLMNNVNSGSFMRRLGRKMFKLNPMVREAWLQRRQAQIEALIVDEQGKAKSIEDLYAVLSSLDSVAKDTATHELILSLLEESQQSLTDNEKADRKVGTGDEELDNEIRSKIKEIISEYLLIQNPTPQQKEQYQKTIADYMKDVANSHPELVGMDASHNFMGFGGAELLVQAEKLKKQLEATMEHEDAMERVHASLDNLELVFGQLQSGANGELAHTKFNDTMERLRSRDTRLGSLLRDNRGFAVGCAVAFGVGVVASRALPSTVARVAGVATLGIGLGASSYFARQQAMARSETDTQLAQIISATGSKIGEDGEYNIQLDEAMRTRQHETVTYNDTVIAFDSFVDTNPDTGEVTIKSGLSPEQVDQLLTVYAGAQGRLQVQQAQNVNLYSTEAGQSIKGGINSLVNVFNAIDEGLKNEYAETKFYNDEQEFSLNNVLEGRRIIAITTVIEPAINAKNEENAGRSKVDGRKAAILAPLVGATVAMGAAELVSMVSGNGIQNPISLGLSLFRPHAANAIGNTAPNSSSQTATIGKSTITTPSGSNVTVHNGTAVFTTPDGKNISNIPVGSDGKISNAGEAIIRQNGFEVQQTDGVPQTGYKNLDMSSSRYIHRLGGNNMKVGNWLDNGTPSPDFDGTELGQNWTVKPNGDLVINQNLGTAYGDGEAVNILHAAQKGNLSTFIRTGDSTLKLPMEIKGDNVQTIIHHGSPESRLFDIAGGSATSKADFVQVGVSHGPHNFSSVSTVPGNSQEVTGKIPISLKNTDITITSVQAPTPSTDFVPPVLPYGFVNDKNRAERVENQDANASQPTPTTPPTPKPAPVKLSSAGGDSSLTNETNLDKSSSKKPKVGDTYKNSDGSMEVEILDTKEGKVTYLFKNKDAEDAVISVNINAFYDNINALGVESKQRSSSSTPQLKPQQNSVEPKDKSNPKRITDFMPGKTYNYQTNSAGVIHYEYAGVTDDGKYKFTSSSGDTIFEGSDLEVLLNRFVPVNAEVEDSISVQETFLVDGTKITPNNIVRINRPYEGRSNVSGWKYKGVVGGQHRFESISNGDNMDMSTDELNLRIGNKNINLSYNDVGGMRFSDQKRYSLPSPYNSDQTITYMYAGHSEANKYIFYEEGDQSKPRELSEQELSLMVGSGVAQQIN